MLQSTDSTALSSFCARRSDVFMTRSFATPGFRFKASMKVGLRFVWRIPYLAKSVCSKCRLKLGTLREVLLRGIFACIQELVELSDLKKL